MPDLDLEYKASRLPENGAKRRHIYIYIEGNSNWNRNMSTRKKSLPEEQRQEIGLLGCSLGFGMDERKRVRAPDNE